MLCRTTRVETRDCTYQGLDAEEAFSGGPEINSDGTCHPLMVGRCQISSKESVSNHEHDARSTYDLVQVGQRVSAVVSGRQGPPNDGLINAHTPQNAKRSLPAGRDEGGDPT